MFSVMPLKFDIRNTKLTEFLKVSGLLGVDARDRRRKKLCEVKMFGSDFSFWQQHRSRVLEKLEKNKKCLRQISLLIASMQRLRIGIQRKSNLFAGKCRKNNFESFFMFFSSKAVLRNASRDKQGFSLLRVSQEGAFAPFRQ